jgi:hypothetical protein
MSIVFWGYKTSKKRSTYFRQGQLTDLGVSIKQYCSWFFALFFILAPASCELLAESKKAFEIAHEGFFNKR